MLRVDDRSPRRAFDADQPTNDRVRLPVYPTRLEDGCVFVSVTP